MDWSPKKKFFMGIVSAVVIAGILAGSREVMKKMDTRGNVFLLQSSYLELSEIVEFGDQLDFAGILQAVYKEQELNEELSTNDGIIAVIEHYLRHLPSASSSMEALLENPEYFQRLGPRAANLQVDQRKCENLISAIREYDSEDAFNRLKKGENRQPILQLTGLAADLAFAASRMSLVVEEELTELGKDLPERQLRLDTEVLF